jgi:hypothetical protein
MPSAGGTVPPVYGFIEAVRAFGDWARGSKRPLHLRMHVGSQVLLNLTSLQISLHELLTSELVRFWTVIGAENDSESTKRVLYRKPETNLKEVLTDLLGDLDQDALMKWSVSLCPSPRRSSEPLTKEDLDTSLCDFGVVFGSVLTLVRRRQENKDAEAASAGT